MSAREESDPPALIFPRDITLEEAYELDRENAIQ